jgi:hypothetical protein
MILNLMVPLTPLGIWRARISRGLGDEYNKLQSDAHTFFKKTLWNLVVMKCCTYYENWHQQITLYQGQGYRSVTDWARQELYPNCKG